VGSVALLGSPSSADLAGLQAIDATAAVPFLVASDEEGGRVQRLASLLGVVPAAADLAARTPEEIADIFRTYGSKLASVGVDVAFAPVVDVGGGPGIGSRAFSDDPAVVTADAGAVIDGYVAAGITPVIKHFPGHGSASGDTHLGFATTPPIDVLRTRDLLPFAELVDREVWVMVGHLLVPGLTEDLPASLSPAAIDGLLRGELGFDGVVVTDALGMGAVAQRWTNPEAALLALLAGADIVMVESPAVVPAVLDHLAAALDDGTLPRGTIDDSLVRVLAAKGVEPCDGSRRLGSPP
jgi:beta-N-acetylhexosaminidase